VTFTDELRRLAFGSVIHFRDPENNLLSLLQPSPAATESPGPRQQARTGAALAEAEGAGVQTSLVLEQEPTLSTGEPRLTAAIVYSLSFPAQREFYKEKLGFRANIDADDWVQFDTGPLSLALRPRADLGAHHSGQPVSFGFAVEDLTSWVDTARERGVTFLGTPTENPMGLMVEAIDPEGNVLTFREPGTEQTLEEHLAEPYEDDEVPHQAAIRKPVKKGTKAVSRVTMKPEYKAPIKKAASKKKARAKGRFKQKPAVAKPRGTGPAGSRVTPKRKRDVKRARSRPAIGRLKKAERASATRKKIAVAKTSRAKPVKRAVRQTRAGGKRTR